MAASFASFLDCLCCASSTNSDDAYDEKRPLLTLAHGGHANSGALSSSSPYEEPPMMVWSPVAQPQNADRTATAIVQHISRHNTLHDLRSVNLMVEDEVIAYGGWDEWLAEKVVNKFVELLQNEDSGSWGESFARAVAKAKEVAADIFDWAEDHPVIVTILATVIVFGIIELVCPWVLGVLGFGEFGPIEASWAARWQSMYGGYVPKGSLFSYLQRLGMIRKRWGWA